MIQSSFLVGRTKDSVRKLIIIGIGKLFGQFGIGNIVFFRIRKTFEFVSRVLIATRGIVVIITIHKINDMTLILFQLGYIVVSFCYRWTRGLFRILFLARIVASYTINHKQGWGVFAIVIRAWLLCRCPCRCRGWYISGGHVIFHIQDGQGFFPFLLPLQLFFLLFLLGSFDGFLLWRTIGTYQRKQFDRPPKCQIDIGLKGTNIGCRIRSKGSKLQNAFLLVGWGWRANGVGNFEIRNALGQLRQFLNDAFSRFTFSWCQTHILCKFQQFQGKLMQGLWVDIVSGKSILGSLALLFARAFGWWLLVRATIGLLQK
mmetsp:Transcript_29683/g.62027  ORF Transcript_29683/g.62027 Transcript_29683/m.62027 type:complete len:316 (+) Transcript_29683:2467-3414(+)